jgi:HEAT repeat protein
MMSHETEIPIQELLDALLDEASILKPRYLYRLTDFEGEELASLAKIWPKISTRRRQALMEDLETLTETDYLLSFEAVSHLALNDDNPQIRVSAIRILLEFDSSDLIPLLLEWCTKDADAAIRATTATALGRFVYLGELDKLPASTLRAIENKLLQIVTGDDQELVRRRALESIGFSSRDEVPSLIQKATNRQDDAWLASALLAMGRSIDQRWNEQVRENIHHPAPLVRLEATRACGELEITDTVPALINLLDEVDDQIRLAAAWSLSQIGGQGVRKALEMLLESTEDEGELDFLEKALDNLSFTKEFADFSIFDYSEDDLANSLNEFNNEDSTD